MPSWWQPKNAWHRHRQAFLVAQEVLDLAQAQNERAMRDEAQSAL